MEMTGLTKHAKTINPRMVIATLHYLDGTRHPVRNKLIFLLSVKMGLRAKEIANLTWSMILDAEGLLPTSSHLIMLRVRGNEVEG
jgi:integrase/recombinase XerD